MIESQRQLKSTRKNFFIFTIIIFLLSLFLALTYSNYYKNILEVQRENLQLVSNLDSQKSLLMEITTLSKNLNQYPKKQEETIKLIRVKSNLLVDKLGHLKKSLVKSSLNSQNELDQLFNNNNFNEKIHKYLIKLQEFSALKKTGAKDISKLNGLVISSNDVLVEVYRKAFDKTMKNVNTTLSRIRNIVLTFFGFCMLGIVLIWVFIYRPFCSTLLKSQESMSKAMLRAESANHAKTEFMANISHEIRTPMTSIVGYLDLLKMEGTKKEDIKLYLDIIKKNANHLLALIDEILNISKVELGKFEIKKSEVKTKDFINEIYQTFNIKVQQKNLSFEVINTTPIPETMLLDATKAKQILMNILNNAVKFTSVGSIKLYISYDKNKDHVVFIVEDTGIGISKKEQKKLFRPFMQLDSSISREYGGTGLGLYLSQAMAQAMGGNVTLEKSITNRGSQFKVRLKNNSDKKLTFFNSLSFDSMKQESLQQNNQAEPLKDKSILVVDDSLENSKLFEIFLKSAGAKVLVANNGKDAVEECFNNDLDLVLLDLQMPEMDGFQVIKKIKEMELDISIVALTAHAMQEEKDKTKKAGFLDHLTKPIESNTLINCVLKYT